MMYHWACTPTGKGVLWSYHFDLSFFDVGCWCLCQKSTCTCRCGNNLRSSLARTNAQAVTTLLDDLVGTLTDRSRMYRVRCCGMPKAVQ